MRNMSTTYFDKDLILHRGLVAPAAEMVEEFFKEKCRRVQMVGSFRRHELMLRDLNVLVEHPWFERLALEIGEHFGCTVSCWVADGVEHLMFPVELFSDGFAKFPVHVIFAPKKLWGLEMVRWTGSDAFLRWLEQRAEDVGVELDWQNGIYRGKRLLSCKTEDEVFNHLGIEWFAAHLRSKPTQPFWG